MTKSKRGNPRTPSAIDREVGARIRTRRIEIGMSQERLADGIGLTFQQVQKYEKGINRVSAGTLIDIAKALQLRPSALLPSARAPATRHANTFDDPELREIIQGFSRLNGDGRRISAAIVRMFAADDRLLMQRKRG